MEISESYRVLTGRATREQGKSSIAESRRSRRRRRCRTGKAVTLLREAAYNESLNETRVISGEIRRG